IYVNSVGKTIVQPPVLRSIDFGADVARSGADVPTKLGGLIAYWQLDEGKGTTAQDASSSKMTATLHGGQWVDGVKGTALQFAKDGDYLVYGDSEKLNFKAGAPFTFAGWVKTKADSGAVVSQGESMEGAGGIMELALAHGRL